MPRIFISHSAKASHAAQLLAVLVEALEAAGHQVLIDREGLKPGDPWRSILNVWMGGCDAAVLLLSDEALKSRFVAYEAAILTYRRELDESFEFVPIILRPVTSAKIKQSMLGSTMITESQAVVIEPQATADGIALVVDRLGQLAPKATPLDKPADLVHKLLKRAEVSDEQMREQLAALDIAMPPWVPGEDLGTLLALSMLASGLERNVHFIRSIRSPLTVQDRGDLVDLLASSWVDYRAIREIPSAATERRVIAANATHPVTARLYVMRSAVDSARLPPRDSWVVAEIDANAAPGDDAPEDNTHLSFEQLRDQVLMALYVAFGAKTNKEVDDELEVRRGHEPVFVALPAETVAPAVLAKLRAHFPDIVFFLMTGSAAPNQEMLGDGVYLEPKLEPDAEQSFYDVYVGHRQWLLKSRKEAEDDGQTRARV